MQPRLLRSVYVFGRPAPHPNRLKLLPAIGSEFVPVDFRLGWAHSPKPALLRKAASLLLCAASFPRRREWDLVIGDGPQHLPVVMKQLGLLGPRQKILPYLAGEFAYFLATGYYGPRKTALLRWWFSGWDGYLCLGPMTADLVRRVLPPPRHRDVFVFQNFIREERVRELGALRPELSGQRLVFLGNGPGGFRVHYKGLDLLLKAFARARRLRAGTTCTVVGEWDTPVAQRLEGEAGLSEGDVRWMGYLPALAETLGAHDLCVHCGRGDAWPNTVMESMVAGVPVLVSEMTGGADMIREVEPMLVAPLDETCMAERIGWYFSLSLQRRRDIGEALRQSVRARCSEAAAVGVFRKTIEKVLEHMDLPYVRLPERAPAGSSMAPGK